MFYAGSPEIVRRANVRTDEVRSFLGRGLDFANKTLVADLDLIKLSNKE